MNCQISIGMPASKVLWLAIAGLAYGASAFAQNRDQANVVEEVVVTSRRTEEMLQATPIAITALTEKSLEQKQIKDLFSVQYSTPGLVIGQTGAGAGATVSLRGQVTVSSEVNVDQSVGLYQDGIYSARQQGGLLNMVDVQRVEILRGPQGTLFGRNTTGGAINIVTNQPTADFGGWAKVGVGNYDSREYTGVINGPLLGDAVAGRLVLQKLEHSGYGRNTYLDTDVGDQNSEYVRGSLLITPPDQNWELLVTGDYTGSKSNGQLLHLAAYNPAAFPASPQPFVDANFYDNASQLKNPDRLYAWGGSATLTVDMDAVTLKSITGVRAYTHRNFSDMDGTPYSVFNNSEDTHHEQYSEELQISGDLPDLTWIGGLYYFTERAHQTYHPAGIIQYDGIVQNDSLGPYAQATYNLTDKLRTTLGARYTIDTRNLQADNEIPAFGVCLTDPAKIDEGTFCTATAKKKFRYWSYTAGLDYQLSNDMFVYAKTSMANKAGGFGKSSPLIEVFEPEKVTDYEIGVKSDWFEHRLRTNAAVFISFYESMQRPVTSGSGALPVVLTQSIGKSKIPGAEFELIAVPIDGLELTANVGLLYPKYTDFSDLTGDRTSEPFTYVSKQTYGLSATYTLPVSYGKYSFHTDYAYQSEKYFFVPIEGLPKYQLQPGFGLVNAMVSLELEESQLQFSLWGKNITGKEYNSFLIDFYLSTGVAPAYRGDPRTFGGTVTYSF